MRHECPMPLRTWVIRTFPLVGSSRLAVCFGPRVGCQTNVLGMRRLLATGTRTIRNRRRLHAALTRDLVQRRQLAETLDRGPHQVVRIRRAEALGQDVGNARAFHDGAHGTTRDHARPWSGGLHEDLSGAVMTDDLVRDRGAGKWNGEHLATRAVDRLPDGFRHFVRLAGREPDAALAVANRNQCVERKAPAALHDLGDAVDRDDVLEKVGPFARLVVTAAPSATTIATAAFTTATPTGITAPTARAALATRATATTTAARTTATAARTSASAAATTSAATATTTTTTTTSRRCSTLILCHVRTPVRPRGRRRPTLSRGHGTCIQRGRRRSSTRLIPSRAQRVAFRPRSRVAFSCPAAPGR